MTTHASAFTPSATTGGPRKAHAALLRLLHLLHLLALLRRLLPLGATAGCALALFALARFSGATVLALVALRHGKEPFAVLGTSWDATWYLGIAEHGYGKVLQGTYNVMSDRAFFPLFPALIRAVAAVTPLAAPGAALLVAWGASAAAAYGMWLTGARLRGRATATALVLVWGLLPHSVVLSMAYTEPLLTAFAAWSLYAVLTGRWLWAGTLAALAGLARPNGFAVAAAVVAGAAWELWRRRGRVSPAPWGSPRLWAGAALAPLGWSAYVLWVGLRTGDPLGGYFEVQRKWGSVFDYGHGTLDYAKHLLRERDGFVPPMALMLVLAAVLLFALLLAERVPLPLVVYSGVLLMVTLGGAGFFSSKPRFLLPAFPLLLPLAVALARTAKARPWHATVVVAALAGLSFAYGAYLVVLARPPL